LLPTNQQIQVQQQLEDYYNDAVTLAAFYYGAKLAILEHWEKRMFDLRNSWRGFLCYTPFPLLEPFLANIQRILAQLLPYDPVLATLDIRSKNERRL
jgi:hypothetical protein